jgi:hypothetical protein
VGRSAFPVVLILATLLNGLLGGISLDKVVVNLPARRRIGVIPYARYARASDLGNGRVLYPMLGIGAAVASIAAFILALPVQPGGQVTLALAFAAALALLHSFTTSKAAPAMLRIGRTDDHEESLKPLLEHFARWSQYRAVLQVASFGTLVWALAAY